MVLPSDNQSDNEKEMHTNPASLPAYSVTAWGTKQTNYSVEQRFSCVFFSKLDITKLRPLKLFIVGLSLVSNIQ